MSEKKTGDELERLGVKTIGQLAKYDEHILVRHFGKAGEYAVQIRKRT